MNIVDTHCHVCLSWYEPADALVHQMDQSGVHYACLVQIKGQYDNVYQSEVARRFPGRFVSVVHIDASAAGGERELERLAAEGARGVRLLPGDPAAIWKRAAALGLPVTIGGSPEELLSCGIEELARTLADLTIIIEHLGSTNRPDGEKAPYPQRSRVFALSRYPNVCMKFHGLGEFCERNMPVTEPSPFRGRIIPILDMAVEAFGPDRLMWGSDYPPVSSREGYGNALRFSRAHLARYGEDAVARMFGGTAKRIYKIVEE